MQKTGNIMKENIRFEGEEWGRIDLEFLHIINVSLAEVKHIICNKHIFLILL